MLQKKELISRPAFSKYMHKHLYSEPSGEVHTETRREGASCMPTHTYLGVQQNSRHSGSQENLSFSVYMYRSDYPHLWNNSHLTSQQSQNEGCIIVFQPQMEF